MLFVLAFFSSAESVCSNLQKDPSWPRCSRLPSLAWTRDIYWTTCCESLNYQLFLIWGQSLAFSAGIQWSYKTMWAISFPANASPHQQQQTRAGYIWICVFPFHIKQGHNIVYILLILRAACLKMPRKSCWEWSHKLKSTYPILAAQQHLWYAAHQQMLRYGITAL